MAVNLVINNIEYLILRIRRNLIIVFLSVFDILSRNTISTIIEYQQMNFGKITTVNLNFN